MPTTNALYHLIPSEVCGEHLLPLNELRSTYTDLCEVHAARHHGREGVIDQPIPPLSCTWGDVLFLAPVDSTELFDALPRAGRPTSIPPAATLDAFRLDPGNCAIRLMRHGTQGHYLDPTEEHDYLPFTTAGLRAVSRVTVAAITRLENLALHDSRLPWVDVPYILHRGTIPLRWFRNRS